MFHDRCTAGPLSQWLDGWIGACCDIHDAALDHSFDLGTFVHGNWAFAQCVWAINPALAVVVFLLVAGPVGLALYLFGPKAAEARKAAADRLDANLRFTIGFSGSTAEEKQAIVARLNEERARQGRPPL